MVRVSGQELEGDEAIPATPVTHCVLKHLCPQQVSQADAKEPAGWLDRERVAWPAYRCLSAEVPNTTQTIAVGRIGQVLLLLGTAEVGDQQPALFRPDRRFTIADGHGIRVDYWRFDGGHGHPLGFNFLRIEGTFSPVLVSSGIL